MAEQVLMVNEELTTDDSTNVEISSNLSQKSMEVVTSDILQRALDEAGGYEQSVLNRTSDHNSGMHDNNECINDHLSDHSYIHSININADASLGTKTSQNVDADCIESNKGLVLSNLQFSNVTDLNNSQELDSSFINDSRKTSINDSGMDRLNIVEDNISEQDNPAESEPTANNIFSSNSFIKSQNLDNQSLKYIVKQNVESLHTGSINPSASFININHSKHPAKQVVTPVGSEENPIKLFHDKIDLNKFHVTQILTKAQLQQITHVIQQEQAKKIANAGKSILYDPNTNTRLVYRIVHPNEVQYKDSKQEVISKLIDQGSINQAGKGRGRPKKSNGRRSEDDEKGIGALSKEERDEKKKHRPRTRSGRISKPPSYMVKDYKRIHHLDFNDEAADDSDGGYTDYHVSDEDKGKTGNKSCNLPPGVTTAKQRSYACVSCSKAYIGRGGLSRHYRLNPGHGNAPEDDDCTPDENSNSSLASSILSSSGTNTNSQSNFFPVNSVKFVAENVSKRAPLNQKNSLHAERKSKVEEILEKISLTELIDILFPKIAQEVSLWKFFTTKCQKKSEDLSLFEMLQEFEKFLAQMQRVALTCLSPATGADREKFVISISNKQTAEALCLEKGPYTVKEAETVAANLKMMEDPFTNVGSIPNAAPETPSEPLYPYAKRRRVDPPVVDVSSGLPEQILSDTHENNSLDLPLAEETLSENVNSQQQQTNLLNVCIDKEDSHELTQKNLFDLNSSTIVTPSSLSSGCLSAINSSQFQKRNYFTAPNDIQHYQNMQVRKMRLLGSSLQNQVSSRTSNPMSLHNFPLSSSCILSDLNTQVQMKDVAVVQSQDELCLDSATGIFTSCPEYSQANLLENHQSSANVVSSASFVNSLPNNNICLTNDSHKVSGSSEVSGTFSNCLVVTNAAHPLENPNTSIGDSDMQTCVPNSIIPTSCQVQTSQFQVTQSQIVSDTAKTTEPSVLRQLMLPNGQLINVWSTVENSNKLAVDQIIQGYLPGSLILLQNSDGSIQVPQNQGATLETMQALSSDSVSSEQARSLTYTSVDM